MAKRICSCFLALLLVFGLTGTVFAAEETDTLIPGFSFSLFEPDCGDDPVECPPEGYTYDRGGESWDECIDFAQPTAWIASWDENDPDAWLPLEEPLVGDRTYLALVTFAALPGYAFDENTRVYTEDPDTWEETECRVVRRDGSSVTVLLEVTAVHDWDWSSREVIEPTCLSEGAEHMVCRSDPAHVRDKVLPADPDAHVWGEWTVLREATKAEDGEREHVCTLCGAAETETIPKFTYPYTPVYEPDTSWTMAATVAWRADSTALAVARGEVRPASAFVWLDKDLNVYDRDGGLLSDDLDAYVAATVGGMIPIFYIRDEETAAALKAWLPVSGLLDCFVVSTPENRALVKDVADLLHIRGMLDCTAVDAPDRAALLDMIASVNGAHGKVILLSEQAATRENIRLLQSLASTVWVQTSGSTRSLLTAYTNGANGVVTEDYAAALAAEERFRDDAPTLLRIPLIIGHRGDPSSYVENTLDSALGAAAEGADSVENDIHLSTDGELFIYHDDTAGSLLWIPDPEDPELGIDLEALTLEELRSHPFSWERIRTNNEVPAEYSRCGVLYGQEEEKEYVVPTLEEYIQAFKGTGIVHDTEIKSNNADIIPVYKALVDRYDAWDQFFTITFNGSILDAMYRDYPELSIGALGLADWTDVQYQDYDDLAREEGPEAAVEALYGVIDQWNATYNNISGEGWGREMVLAARHRGLTVWPWTYTLFLPDRFAEDYLFGVTGMTGDFPWIASDYLVEITAGDAAAPSVQELPRPMGKTQDGKTKLLSDAEPVWLERLSARQDLMIWRYRAELTVDGESYGSYYLYSNPFVYTCSQPVVPPAPIEPSEPRPPAPAEEEAAIDPDTVRAAAEASEDLTVEREAGTIRLSAELVKAAAERGMVLAAELRKNGDGSVTAAVTLGGEPVAGEVRIALPAEDPAQVPVLLLADGSRKPVRKSLNEAGTVFALVPAGADVALTEIPAAFPDAAAEAWYADAAAWSFSRELIQGTGKGFEPDIPMTRAMLAAVLFRLEEGSAEGRVPFPDVPADAWYADAVTWAAHVGIIQGTGKGFEPCAYITREQTAAILFRYGQLLGLDTAGRASLSGFPDGGETSGWAEDAMAWAVSAGLLRGNDAGALEPRGRVTRAQAAVLLQRLASLMVR